MIIPLKNVTIFPNQDLDLNGLASSSGVLTYDWSKHNGNMPQNAEKSYSHTVFFNSLNGETTLGYNLKVQNVQPLDEGWYCCVAAIMKLGVHQIVHGWKLTVSVKHMAIPWHTIATCSPIHY